MRLNIGVLIVDSNRPHMLWGPGCLALVGVCLLCLIGCDNPARALTFGSNPIYVQSQYGLVKEAYVRVKDAPSSKAADADYLKRGELIEILGSQRGKECIEAETGLWYRVKTTRGLAWVFSGYVDAYDSPERARLAADKLGM